MVPWIDSADLTRIILLFSGVALIILGFYGIGEDIVHNWTVEEYSSLAILLSGAAILLVTTVVYVILPEYQSHRRIEILRQYYMAAPKGEMKDIRHNIMERSQGIMSSTELLAGHINDCVREDTSLEQCKNNTLKARKMLNLVDTESIKLRELLDKLDDYLISKKQ
jgi:Co/Zn/Cd efflux system component